MSQLVNFNVGDPILMYGGPGVGVCQGIREAEFEGKPTQYLEILFARSGQKAFVAQPTFIENGVRPPITTALAEQSLERLRSSQNPPVNLSWDRDGIGRLVNEGTFEEQCDHLCRLYGIPDDAPEKATYGCRQLVVKLQNLVLEEIAHVLSLNFEDLEGEMNQLHKIGLMLQIR